MDSKKVQKVSVQELMQIAVKKYNMNDDITFSKQAIEKFMRDIFHDKKSPYYSYVEKVPAKDRQDSLVYKIAVTDETIRLVINLIVLYNMIGPVVLKGLILENKFKKNIFDERINKIANDIRQLELLAANQDVLYKLFEEHEIQKENELDDPILEWKAMFEEHEIQKENELSSNNNQQLFSDFIKSIDILHELSSSKISSSKHLSYEDRQLLLYPNKINIENDKDKLIRDIELSMYHHQFSIAEEIIEQALVKYPDEIIFLWLKFKFYHNAKTIAIHNFTKEYVSENKIDNHEALLAKYSIEANTYHDKLVDILLQILDLWPKDERKYKQLDYETILGYLILFRKEQTVEYEVIETDEPQEMKCYTEQFFKESYELYEQDCQKYSNGYMKYSYDEFKRYFLCNTQINYGNKIKNKYDIPLCTKEEVKYISTIKYKYKESEKDKKILSYVKKIKSIYDKPLNVTKYDMLEFFRKTSPEEYKLLLQEWKKNLNIIYYNDVQKPPQLDFIETVLQSYNEYYGKFDSKGAIYLADAFDPEELKSLLGNMKARYIEYIEKLFAVSYTRFYITQQCIHVDDLDDYDYESDFYHD